jgi:hypothetical protein
MERTLYNGLISGVSLDGKLFFYPNPLESNGQHQRSPWFGVACCPGNITRFLASVPGYVYAQQGDKLYINLFASSSADIKLDNGQEIRVLQDTAYPWDGTVKITVNPKRAGVFTINVRIPGWARNEVIPGDLYRFQDKVDDAAILRINGKQVSFTLDKGYASLTRSWKIGDIIELRLPMAIRRVAANDRVEADRGRVAIQRGPIVYCAEWPDNPQGHVRNLMVPDVTKLSAEFKSGLLGGVMVVKGNAIALAYDEQDKVVQREQEFTAIPYFAWANRGPGEMIVWIPNSEAAARPLPRPTIASTSKVSVSNGRNPRAINDQAEPRSSEDPSNTYFHWWPRKGTTEWVEYAFAEPSSVSEVEVYWFDDTGHGECRVPRSWRVLYKEGDQWKPVENRENYGIEKDRYNKVTFKAVVTAGLRLEVSSQPNWAAGIQEWKVR